MLSRDVCSPMRLHINEKARKVIFKDSGDGWKYLSANSRIGLVSKLVVVSPVVLAKKHEQTQTDIQWIWLDQLLLTFARGRCLGASLVCIAVCALADDSPISDKTDPAAEGVCSIGILMCVLFVSVFIPVEEFWEGFATAKHCPCVGLLGCFMQLLWLEEHGRCQLIFYNPSHLGLVDEVRGDWLFPPFTGEKCG